MEDMKALLSALPSAPDYRYDWDALSRLPCLKTYFDGMAQTHQHLPWHGEDDVWTHTKMVCEALASLPDFRALPDGSRNALALAALLHDIGKISCTRLEEGILRSPRHGPVGAQLARRMLWTEFGLSGAAEKQRFREAVCLLIRYHTQPLHLFEKQDADTQALKLAANGELVPDFTWHTLCLLSEADALGRIAADKEEKVNDVQLTRETAREAGCYDQPFPFASSHTQRALFRGGRVWPGQELYDDTWGEVILLCGLPGTGKDTWIRENHPGLPTVCLDDLRVKLGVKPGSSDGHLIQAAKEQAREYLRARQPFIWNATCLTEKRKEQVSLFESYGARVKIIFLETGWEENLRRNAGRKDAVPEHVIAGMLADLEPPQRYEAQSVEWVCV